MTCAIPQLKKKTRKDRRIEILQDALARLRYRKVEDSHGYVVTNYLNNIPDDVQLQSEVKNIEKNCTVCALGGLFLSAVDKFNHLKKNECDIDSGVFCYHRTPNIKRDTINTTLSKYFSERQLYMMEVAFEISSVSDSYECLGKDLENVCIEFGKRYGDPKNRLRAILKNALANDGIFKV